MSAREQSPFMRALDRVGRNHVAMRDALQRASDSYTEGEEQRQVRTDLQQDFPAFVQRAREMEQTTLSSGITYNADEVGGESVQLWVGGEIISVTKSINPETHEATFDVIPT